MEFSVPRRKMNTYGKAARKIKVHDLFDVATKSEASEHHLRSPSNRTNPQPNHTSSSYATDDRESARQLKQDLKAATTGTASVDLFREISPCSTPADASSPSLFEIESSSDDGSRSQTSAGQKRRKLTPQPPLEVRVSAGNLPLHKAGRLPQTTRLAPSIVLKPQVDKAVSKGRKAPDSQSPARAEQNSTVAHGKLPGKGPLKKSNSPLAQQSDSEIQHQSTAPSASQRRATHKKSRSIGSPTSDKSSGSMVSARGTPKRKRQVAGDIPSDVSSPSHIELSSLRFTPERSVQGKLWAIELDNSDSSAASPQRNRRRLIDRLDGPKADNSSQDVSMDDIQGNPKLEKVGRVVKTHVPPNSITGTASLKVAPVLERTASSQSVNSVGRQRLTYGKQRSHLSDMVDSLENHSSGAASQTSLHQLESQVSSLGTKGSQFDFDDDDGEEAAAVSRLKSIHELRQAGAVNRFDRDLDALLEDIESESKALRLQGFMQLVRKLQEQAFKRHLLDSDRLRRLTACSSSNMDICTAMVLLLALWALINSEATSAAVSSQIYGALLRLPPNLIGEDRSLASVARDRNENLSKALIRDIASFEAHVLEHSTKGARKTSQIVVSRIFLLCLQFTLEKVIDLRERVPEPPSQLIDEVLKVMQQHVVESEVLNNPDESIERINGLLCWLERTSACWHSGTSSPSPSQCYDLGKVLAQIMRRASSRQLVVEQSCLKLAVSLSNNDVMISQQFAATSLLNTICGVVEAHFTQLAETAIQETDFDESKLNSVILALGCLLNFAECSDGARRSMMRRDDGGQSQINRLVNIFNRYVDQTDEAITINQAQIAVAFGWVSMLLCTLCLDDIVRPAISQEIKGDRLEKLLKATTEFLEYLEASTGGSEGPSDFTVRFRPLLETLRLKEMT